MNSDSYNLVPTGLVTSVHPSWLHKLPPHLQFLLKEVYQLAETGRSALAVGGLRTLVEAVAREVAGRRRPMRECLQELLLRGFIGVQELERLMLVVAHGNRAIHEIVAVEGEELRHLLLSVEHLLLGYFVLRRRHPACEDRPPREPPD
jgi:hypothetical protein